MRRIVIFFLICPEERSIIAESGLIAGFCDGGAPAQELVCVLEAFFGQVFGNGVAGFLAEETHHVVFAYVKAGGELVDRKGRSERIPDGFRRRRDRGVP